MELRIIFPKNNGITDIRNFNKKSVFPSVIPWKYGWKYVKKNGITDIRNSIEKCVISLKITDGITH